VEEVSVQAPKRPVETTNEAAASRLSLDPDSFCVRKWSPGFLSMKNFLSTKKLWWHFARLRKKNFA